MVYKIVDKYGCVVEYLESDKNMETLLNEMNQNKENNITKTNEEKGILFYCSKILQAIKYIF